MKNRKVENYVLHLSAMRSLFILLCLSGLVHQNVLGQSRSQDSLSLLSFYQNLEGDGWNNSENWKSFSLDKWYGVELQNDLIWNINLPNNNLNGSLKATDVPNHPFGTLNLSNNNLSGLPSVIPADSLYVDGNALTFTHLMPYSSRSLGFTYANQDSVEIPLNVIGLHRGEITLSTTTDAGLSGISYQWIKDGNELDGDTNRELKLRCLTLLNEGSYTCRIQHASLPALALFRNIITLTVTSDDARPGPDDHVCAGEYVLRGKNPVLGVGEWSAVGNTAIIVDPLAPNSRVTNLTAGSHVFQWTVTYGNCPLDSARVIITKDTVGEFPNAGRDSVICDTIYSMNAVPLKYGNGSWEIIQGTLILAQASNPECNLSGIAPGENILRWNANNGACASFFDEVKITRVMPVVSTIAGKDTALCGTELFLDATPVINESGVWRLVQGQGKLVDPVYENAYIYGLGEGDNLWVWSADNACNIPVEDTVIVHVHNFVYLNTGPDTTMYYTPSSPLIIGPGDLATGGTGQFIYLWTPGEHLLAPSAAEGRFKPPSIGTYMFDIKIVDEMGCSDSGSREVIIIQVQQIDIPTLFTPNSDGLNDQLILPGIESYPESELVIMDKFGQVVFRTTGYNNQWSGVASEGYFAGKDLPEDTYFYFLNLTEDKERLQKGFIELKR